MSHPHAKYTGPAKVRVLGPGISAESDDVWAGRGSYGWRSIETAARMLHVPLRAIRKAVREGRVQMVTRDGQSYIPTSTSKAQVLGER